jgi:class 3 adenylate cyclase
MDSSRSSRNLCCDCRADTVPAARPVSLAPAGVRIRQWPARLASRGLAAIRCASALRDGLAGIGVQIRAGLHTGEVELRDGDVSGIAVHIAARILAAAQPGDIMTSGPFAT